MPAAISLSSASCASLPCVLGMQGVPARKLCPGRDRLPLCTPRRQHHDRHKRQYRNRLYGLHKGALHEGEMQIFSPSCPLAGQNQSCAAPSQPSGGGRPGSRGRGHSHGKWGARAAHLPPPGSARAREPPRGSDALPNDRDLGKAATPAAPLPKFCCGPPPPPPFCFVSFPPPSLLQHNK